MRKLLPIILLLFPVILQAQEKKLVTWFEQSDGKQTPRYAETIEFCKLLAASSPMIHYGSFGESPQGRELPLLILDRDGLSDPAEIRKQGRVVLMIQACIHSGESDGKDAGFLLFRDMITKPENTELLKNVSVLFIPILNVDGHERFGPYNRINQNGPEEMGWRTTAQNLNLNRDYMKADAPEMQSWLKLYSAWLPEFFIDCHVTDGADYQYVLTYALETRGTMDKNLTEWTDRVCEPFLVGEMDKAGYPIFPYVEFRQWHDPRSGLESQPAPPMLSQGYLAVRNRPGLLIESHMLKPYQQRVEATYELLKLVMRLLDREHTNLQKSELLADEYVAGSSFRKEPFTVSWATSSTDSVMINFKGFEYTIETSDLTGGPWFRYDNTKPATWNLPWFNRAVPETSVRLPEAYIVPPEWTDIISRMQLHGILMKPAATNFKIPVSVLRFSNVKWQPRSYEGRLKVNYSISDSVQVFEFPAGSMIIDMNQPAARVIAHLLEPASPDSYMSWGFFNTILEQKEYFESYVMEPEARKMIKADPALKEAFEKEKISNPRFAGDPYAQLGWFYNRSPWKDSRYNVYPIGRILDRKLLENIPTR